MEYFVIILFSLILLASVFFSIHLLYALLLGYMLFFAYGLYKGCKAKELFWHSWNTTKNIGSMLLLFCLIGILTATWRASGTIAFLVVSCAPLLIPSLIVFSSFILCVFISLFTGTAFGTSATMGVICMTMGNVLGVDPAFLGGAIFSGSYFGDRMSPMSSSAHLVAKITRTDIFKNIKNMFMTCLIPLLVTSIFYLYLGFENSQKVMPLETLTLFRENFVLTWPSAIPALLVLGLVVFKVNIKKIMLVSIVSASILCIFLQDMSAVQLLTLYWAGFTSPNPMIHSVLGGGGLVSMMTVVCVVGLSSSYIGIFQVTRLLENIKEHIVHLAERVSPFGSTCVVALFTCMLTCNQTLSIFLTKSLCEPQYAKAEDLALSLENTVVLMAGLVPWNIACSVVLANVDAPVTSIFYASFLYLTPMVSFFIFRRRMKSAQNMRQ